MPPSPTASRIVVVDDDTHVCELVARVLTRAGHVVITANSGEDALQYLNLGAVDCLVVDKHLPGMNGAEIVAEARRRMPGLPVVLITAHPEPFSLGAERPDVCLAKPFRDLVAIEEAVALALESVTGETALTGLRERLTQVVTETMSPMRKKRE